MKILMKILLVLVLILGGIMPDSVEAQETDFKLYVPDLLESDIEVQSISYYGIDDLSQEDVLFLLEELVKEAILDGDDNIYLNQYGLKIEDHPWILYLHCFSPYFSNGIDLSVYTDMSRKYYALIHVDNTMTLKETKQYFKEVEEKISEIKSLLSEDYSDEKNALILHDYLVYESEYDVEALESGVYEDYKDSFRSGGIVMDNIGVCQGYAFAYKYFLNLVDMECYYNSSEEMVHGWNIVNIDGKYYQVDCTYDDPIPDRLTKVRHTYFLKSDDYFYNDHSGWEYTNLVCDDKYDDYYFNDVESQIVVAGDDYYYITSDGFVKSDSTGDNKEVLHSLGYWRTKEGTWYGKYSGLFRVDDYLYFNTSSVVYRYNINTGITESFYTPELDDMGIYGVLNKDDSLYLVLRENPNESAVLEDTSIELDSNIQYPTSVVLNRSTLSLTVGDNVTLEASVYPTDAKDQSVYWSSNNDVVSVEDGVVTALKAGTAVVTVTTVNGLTDTCRITVENPVIELENIILSKQELSLTAGDTYELDITFKPEDATNKNVYWISTNEDVATVQDGKITALSAGTTRIIVKTDSDVSAECVVYVSNKVIEVTSVDISKNRLQLDVGESAVLTADIYPSNASDSTLIWSSSDEEVVSVKDGVVTALKEGTAVVTVSSANGKSDECEVTVTSNIIEVTSVDISKNRLQLEAGESAVLTADIYPSNASDSTLIWTSSDEEVVSVQDGVVTALKAGTAVVTVSSANGKSDDCEVTVKETVSSIELSKQELVLYTGETYELEVTYFPGNGQDVTWTSSDKDVVKVKDGKVEALSAGTAVVTVRVGNKLSASCVVIVKDAPEFSDVHDYDWYNEYVKEAYKLGLMTGATDTLFKPTVKMNRGMVAIVLHRMEGEEEVEFEQLFSDVDGSADEYYSESVTWAKVNGVINGYGNGTFRPLNQVTRQEMAQMIYNFAVYKGVDVESDADFSLFKDGNTVSSWHIDAMKWAVANGVISGKDNGTRLDPLGTASRAECSKMLVQAYKYIYK